MCFCYLHHWNLRDLFFWPGGVKGQGLNKSPGSGSQNDFSIARNADVLAQINISKNVTLHKLKTKIQVSSPQLCTLLLKPVSSSSVKSEKF